MPNYTSFITSLLNNFPVELPNWILCPDQLTLWFQRHVFQPQDKSIGLFCNVIYIKASGVASLKRPKMLFNFLSGLCLGGAINSTGHSPTRFLLFFSSCLATKGIQSRIFRRKKHLCKQNPQGKGEGGEGRSVRPRRGINSPLPSTHGSYKYQPPLYAEKCSSLK